MSIWLFGYLVATNARIFFNLPTATILPLALNPLSLNRSLALDFSYRIRAYLSIDQSLPAAGQGAIGIECREGDEATMSLIAALNHAATHACVVAERAVCRKLNGGCQTPLASYAEIHHGVLTLRGLVVSSNGTRKVSAKHQGDPAHADSIGLRVAEELLQQGAEKILRSFHEH